MLSLSSISRSFFRQRRTAGFACGDHRAALRPKGVGQGLDMRGFTRTVDAFKN